MGRSRPSKAAAPANEEDIMAKKAKKAKRAKKAKKARAKNKPLARAAIPPEQFS